MKKLSLRFGLGAVLVLALAGIAVQPAASHPVDNPWAGTGSGTTNVVSDGTSGPAVLSYNYFGNPCCGATGSWSFSTVASSTRTVELNWTYTGFNAYYQVTVGLDAFVTDGATTTTTPLVHDGPVNCCTPPSGGFSYTGSVSLSVQAGDTYGFKMNGHNFDSNATLQGTLTVDDPDVTAPDIAITTPANGASYTLGSNVAADYSCADEADGSGLASCAGPVANSAAIDTSTIGQHTFTVNAEDNAGNKSSKTNTYSVNYNFNGFFQPVDNLPTLNSVKAGQAIPVKFSLSGNQGLAIFAAGYPTSEQISCDSSDPVDGIEETVNAGGSSLSYDPVTDTYNYVWKTDKAWATTCRELIVKLSDGTEHRADFKFTK
jgi:hypothetical protein